MYQKNKDGQGEGWMYYIFEKLVSGISVAFWGQRSDAAVLRIWPQLIDG